MHELIDIERKEILPVALEGPPERTVEQPYVLERERLGGQRNRQADLLTASGQQRLIAVRQTGKDPQGDKSQGDRDRK